MTLTLNKIEMLREASKRDNHTIVGSDIRQLCVLARVALETDMRIATWITAQGYATGHGDTLIDMLEEFAAQLKDKARNDALEDAAHVADNFMGDEHCGCHVISDNIRALKVRS